MSGWIGWLDSGRRGSDDKRAGERLSSNGLGQPWRSLGGAPLRPYVWRRGDAEREAWVQQQVAAAKARVRELAP